MIHVVTSKDITYSKRGGHFSFNIINNGFCSISSFSQAGNFKGLNLCQIFGVA
jgi:hypothetical protein